MCNEPKALMAASTMRAAAPSAVTSDSTATARPPAACENFGALFVVLAQGVEKLRNLQRRFPSKKCLGKSNAAPIGNVKTVEQAKTPLTNFPK